ncbi:MAG: hypothetical protein J0L73_28175 [Verrucomicrobia bacterium]|nr:hypothetical protein [Verrucomicrobiota bacterium]
MSADSPLLTRLRAASPGLGQGSRLEIEERAAELALSDGREIVSDADLALAAAELAGGGTTMEVPEAGGALKSWTGWYELPLQCGHLEITSSAEDDGNSIAEQLIENGLEEADHDIRVTAEMERRDFRRA